MQGISWGFRGAGAAFGGIVLGNLIDKIGYEFAYQIIGSLMVLGCLLSLSMKEPALKKEVLVKDIIIAFGKKETWIISIFDLLGGMALSIVLVLSTFLNQELGISIQGIGMSVTFFALGQFFGAIIIGFLGQHMSLKAIFLINGIALIGLIFSFLY